MVSAKPNEGNIALEIEIMIGVNEISSAASCSSETLLTSTAYCQSYLYHRETVGGTNVICAVVRQKYSLETEKKYILWSQRFAVAVLKAAVIWLCAWPGRGIDRRRLGKQNDHRAAQEYRWRMLAN